MLIIVLYFIVTFISYQIKCRTHQATTQRHRTRTRMDPTAKVSFCPLSSPSVYMIRSTNGRTGPCLLIELTSWWQFCLKWTFWRIQLSYTNFRGCKNCLLRQFYNNHHPAWVQLPFNLTLVTVTGRQLQLLMPSWVFLLQ